MSTSTAAIASAGAPSQPRNPSQVRPAPTTGTSVRPLEGRAKRSFGRADRVTGIATSSTCCGCALRSLGCVPLRFRSASTKTTSNASRTTASLCSCSQTSGMPCASSSSRATSSRCSSSPSSWPSSSCSATACSRTSRQTASSMLWTKPSSTSADARGPAPSLRSRRRGRLHRSRPAPDSRPPRSRPSWLRFRRPMRRPPPSRLPSRSPNVPRPSCLPSGLRVSLDS